MNADLHRWLDGELPREALPPEAAAEADEWSRLLDAAASLPAGRAPADLAARVMAALPPARPEPAWKRWAAWLTEPLTLQVRPLGPVLAGAAALLVFALALPRGEAPGAGDLVVETPEPSAAAEPRVYVQFVFATDNASSVALAGDFNGWEPGRTQLRDLDGDGVWTGLVALDPGVHKYMFVVDGEQWVTDPRAERYVDDGFGMRNALIAVAAPLETPS